jgi:hypothetical protein
MAFAPSASLETAGGQCHAVPTGLKAKPASSRVGLWGQLKRRSTHVLANGPG